MQSLSTQFLIIMVLAVSAYFLAKSRAMQVAGGDIRTLVSLPRQHALNTVMSTVVQPLAVILLTSVLNNGFSAFQQTFITLDPARRSGLYGTRIRRYHHIAGVPFHHERGRNLSAPAL